MIKLLDIINEAKKVKETFEEFAKKRGEGAAKIAESAQSKGGLAMLTYNHFKVKNPKRRAAFRARHNCKNPGPRWKARYWSCKAW